MNTSICEFGFCHAKAAFVYNYAQYDLYDGVDTGETYRCAEHRGRDIDEVEGTDTNEQELPARTAFNAKFAGTTPADLNNIFMEAIRPFAPALFDGMKVCPAGHEYYEDDADAYAHQKGRC